MVLKASRSIFHQAIVAHAETLKLYSAIAVSYTTTFADLQHSPSPRNEPTTVVHKSLRAPSERRMPSHSVVPTSSSAQSSAPAMNVRVPYAPRTQSIEVSTESQSLSAKVNNIHPKSVLPSHHDPSLSRKLPHCVHRLLPDLFELLWPQSRPPLFCLLGRLRHECSASISLASSKSPQRISRLIVLHLSQGLPQHPLADSQIGL